MPTSLIKIETKKVTSELIKMLKMVQANHHQAQLAVKSFDRDKALMVLEDDKKIDAKMYEIVADLEFMVTKAPVAKEMRRTLASLRIVGELERIGDYAKNIAKFIIKSESVDKSTITRISKVHSEFQKMLIKVEDIITSESIDSAIKLASMDQKVNGLVQDLRKEIIASITSKKSISLIEQRVFSLNVINALERAADHIVIICELITYIATGNHASYN